MVINDKETVNAILIGNDFIKEIRVGDSLAYVQTLGELKFKFLDGFKLSQMDKVLIRNSQ